MNRADYPIATLGAVLRQDLAYISALEPRQYRKLSVKLYGRGVSLDSPADGAMVKMPRHQLAKPGQVILSEIWAKKGAVGIVPDEGDGALCTSHFFLFDIDTTKCRREWLRYIFMGNYLAPQLETLARGSTGYAAVRPHQFLGLSIPLPLPEEQDQIVARLDSAAARVSEAQHLCREIDEEADALCRSILSDPRQPTTPTPMRELVTPRPPDVEVKAQESYHFAGIYCFGKGMFRGQTRLGAEFSYATLSRVRTGDFAYPKLMAWEGALCVVPPECDGLYVSTEYPVFEINRDRVLPDVLDVYFRSPEVWPKLSGTSKGTNVRRRRLNPQQFLDYVMPLPTRDVQERVAEVRAKLAGVKSQHASLVTELEALMPAILDRAFKGELSTAEALANTASVDAGETSVIACGSLVPALAVPMLADTKSAVRSMETATADKAPVATTMAPGYATAAAGMQVAVPRPTRSAGADTVETWNIPEIAAVQAELVRRNGGSATLGRKKISKGAYLAAALLGAKQNPPPLRKAAGPFNTQAQGEIEAYAAQAGWFSDSGQHSGQRSVSRYRAGPRIAEASRKATSLISARAADFERFVRAFAAWDSDAAELHATAHAAWNGLLAAGKPVNEAAIIDTFFDWSQEKAKFTRSQVRSALSTLRTLGLEPDGSGPVVAGIAEETLFTSGRTE